MKNVHLKGRSNKETEMGGEGGKDISRGANAGTGLSRWSVITAKRSIITASTTHAYTQQAINNTHSQSITRMSRVYIAVL